MNPIFIAHLTADFLLQPTWLARLKEKAAAGLSIHILIHAFVLVLIFSPILEKAAPYILIITVMHGIIDYIKIKYPKKSFELAFLIDQLFHFCVLLAVSFVLKPYIKFWDSESGAGILNLLVFFSFAAAQIYLTHLKKYPLASNAQKTKRILTIVAVFALFLMPTFLGQF
ncbi:DUF3307 domain-containing protein [Candidatus Peregrinibacteria bacterium]|nr:DUF3307 domain-containing protein [Candidatus Peregrinibacteria bacterium]